MSSRFRMMTKKTLALLVSVVALGPLVTASTLAANDVAETVTHVVSGNKDIWTISAPSVNVKSKDYRDIRFEAKDTVTINAGGCVQTGGSGRTWKLYVDPKGPNSNRLYHGLISIPGVTNDLERIAGWNNKTFPIPGNVGPSPLFLQLGYEDDVYRDNGYYAHDDGTGNQCKNVGPAFVKLTITHAPRPPTSTKTPTNTPTPTTTPPPPPPPMNLVSDAHDDNGLFLNPKWAYQLSHSDYPDPSVLCNEFKDGKLGSPPCTTQPVFYNGAIPFAGGKGGVPGVCGGTFSKSGHYNWAPATYEGTIYWIQHFGGLFGDDDYNMLLVPDGMAGVTFHQDDVSPILSRHPGEFTNLKGILAEFDSDETIDNFSSRWWQQFHNAVDDNDVVAASMVDGRRAIVTGLVGLDGVHESHGELHPVWAMAIEVNDDPVHDTWAIFVRNWGNEGSCGPMQELLDITQLKLRLPLPARPGVTGVDINSAGVEFKTDSRQASVSIEASTDSNGGVVVTFNLPPPDSHKLVDGQIEINWDLASSASQHTGLTNRSATRSAAVANIGQGENTAIDSALIEKKFAQENAASGLGTAADQDTDPEAQLEALWASMSPNQQSTYIQNYPNISSPPDDTIVIAGSALTITKVPKLPVVIPPILPKVITGAITSRVINRYEAQYNAFRFAFDGKIPGLPPEEHVFTETGISLAGRFLEYWNTHGGLAQQGFPITPPLTEISDLDGKPYTVQYFERAVFEYHPNNVGTLYDVLLSQLGSLQYREKYPNGALGQIPNPNNPGFFPQTGHTLGGRFRDYWNNNGGLAQFGYPISEEFTEISDLDNKPYIVQYFERAVFEYHPENNIPFDTLLSQLGTLRYHQKYNVKTFKLTP